MGALHPSAFRLWVHRQSAPTAPGKSAPMAVEMGCKNRIFPVYKQKKLKNLKSQNFIYLFIFQNNLKIQILDSLLQQKIVAFQSSGCVYSYAI